MTTDKVKALLAAGRIDEADRMAEEALRRGPRCAELLYLRGQAAMKRSAWGEAISLFLQAEALEPGGPAREAREMLDDIMAFYNKDMYNQ
ncbi:MAG: tetratricopeptide repeat protein [Alloprevotella sp.]|nr:tetratricopeptide repeat protein [Alloprevotella sp.]